MGEIRGYATAALRNPAVQYGYLNSPPKVFTVLAQDIQYKASGSLVSGRYSPVAKSILAPEVMLRNGTCLHGSGGSGDRKFTKLSGQADDNFYHPLFHLRGILCNDGSTGGSYDLLADYTAMGGIETATILIARGPQPPGSTVNPATCFTRIELASGMDRNLSILFAYMQPIQVQFTTDGGFTWFNVDCEIDHGDPTLHFANNEWIGIYIKPHREEGIITIETSTRQRFRFRPSDSWIDNHPVGEWLPGQGRIRVYGRNGWAAFIYQPNRHGSVQVAYTHRLGYEDINAGKAWLSEGAGAKQNDQTYTNSVTPSGNDISWQSQLDLPDAGDGLGSLDPGRWTAGQLIIPPDFTFGVPGGENSIDIVFLRLSGVTIVHDLDDNTRLFGSAITDLVANNDNLIYGPEAANLAMVVETSNDGGATMVKHGEYIVGVGSEGFVLDNPSAGMNDLKGVAVDRAIVMGSSNEEPVVSGVEVVMDGWAKWSAIRYWAHRGNIHNDYLTKLPDATGNGIYVPPRAPGPEAPYGRAGSDYTGPIMPEGTGDEPISVFPVNISPIAALQMIVADMAETVIDIYGERIAPYYMGFDEDSYLIIEPFDPVSQQPVYGLTDRPLHIAERAYPTIAWVQIASGFHSSTNITQLRSELTLAGQDWVSNELLIEHRQNSPAVREAIGYNRTSYMQSERWGDQDYLSRVADGVQALTSLPTMVCGGRLPHFPQLRMGMSVMVWHPGVSLEPVAFYLTRVVHRSYDGAFPILDTQFLARRVTAA